jgi:hypothetical protein
VRLHLAFVEIESWTQNGSDPKVAPAAASASFVRVEVRSHFQFRKLLVGDATELLQGSVDHFPQFGFGLNQITCCARNTPFTRVAA